MFELPSEMAEIKGLKYLDLSRNRLKKWPSVVCEFSQLTSLIYQFNQRTNVSNCLSNLKELVVLDFSFTPLISLPPQVFSLPNLNLLNLFLAVL